MASPDPHFSRRMTDWARLIRGENRISAAAATALEKLAAYAARALGQSGMDPAVLDTRAPEWRAAITDDVLPQIEEVFRQAFHVTANGMTVDPRPYAIRHLEATTDRLVGVADGVFDGIRTTLAEGRQKAESIPELTARVDEHLKEAGADRWAGRARTIARTETISANNAGAQGAARAVADTLGVEHGDVARTWLSTGDGRTRESHVEADGQQVIGLGTPFSVGGYDLDYPGDPFGPPEETINCRCTFTVSYPGDPDYPLAASAAGAPSRGTMTSDHQEAAMTSTPPETDPPVTEDPEDDTPTGVVIVALPAAGDDCLPIGEEQKHATVCYLGDGLDTTTVDAVLAALQGWTGSTDNPGAAFSETVTGVESLGDDGARVWMLSGDTLPAIRSSLMDVQVIGDAMNGADQFPTYNPHVTIGYPAQVEDPAPAENDAQARTGTLGDDVETAAAGITSITFDRLALWAGPDQTEVTLTPTTDEPAMTAAAGDPAPTPREASAGEPAPEPTDAAIALDSEDDDQFYGVCVVEDSQTGDGRVFASGALQWDVPMPIPLGWQVQDAPGHDGSVVCGRIDTFTRFGNLIAYTGTWDLGGAGWETRRLVEGAFLTGLSVDTDDFDAEVVDAEGNPVDPFMMMMGEDTEAILLVTGARVRSAVMCRVPAFVEAFIANGVPPAGWAGQRAAQAVQEAPDDGTDTTVDNTIDPGALPADATVVAALVAAAVKAGNPPAATVPNGAMFTNPDLTAPTPMTLSDDGRVFGHLATWGVCHIGFDGVCVEAPPSSTEYAYFATGLTETTDGLLATGPLTMETGHAAPNLRAGAAVAHYDNTGTVVADVVMGQDDVGIWFSGVRRPDLTDTQVRAMRSAGAVSGDWRTIGDHGLELVAALVVNTPGFPIPRTQIAASAGRQVSLVASGMVPPADVEETKPDLYREFRARMAREDRAHAAFGRLAAARVAKAQRMMDHAAAAKRARRVAAATARMERSS